jgi:predicted transcriptional regulator
MLETIKARPGIPVVELKSAVPMGWGTLSFHIRCLEKQGVVQSQVSGRRRLLYPTATTDEAAVPVLVAEAVLRGKTARAVYEGIRANPGLGLPELCRILDRSPRVVYHHVLRLVERGLVRSDSSTRYVGLVAVPPAEAVGAATPQQDQGNSRRSEAL